MAARPEGSHADDRNPLELLIDDFLRRLGEGEALSVESFAAEHPEQGDRIREILPTVLAMEKYKRGREVNVGGRASLGGRRLERLGDYRLLRELGRGGMGVVFEAVQETLGRKVAIKILPNQHLLGMRQVERFRREAKIAASLHHTNIVPIFGTGEQQGYHFFVMQLIRGITLDELVGALRRLDEGVGEEGEAGAAERAAARASARSLAVALRRGVLESLSGGARGRRAYWHAVARIGHQAADALEYAHGEKVLHRDIKPGNLMLDAQGRIWITDFGLSKAPDADSLTRSGCFAGTPAYMAPEQVDGRYDERTDIHGLGLVLYELLTLRPAFREQERSRLIKLITTREPEPPGRQAAGLPRDLETIVVKCLVCDPAGRYQTARELKRDLRSFLQGRPIAARRITMVERAWQWCGRNPGMAWLATLALVAVLAAMAVGWIAFGVTREALASESRQARRAEANLELALEAIGGIFTHLGRGPDPTTTLTEDGEERYEPMVQPPVDPDYALLLERMLRFFDRFAQANRDSPRLRGERVMAYRKMGDIHQRLGDYDEALAAYEKALEGLGRCPLDRVERALHEAAVHNEIGRVRRRAGENLSCLEAHRRARRVLESVPAGELPPRGRYELARTLNFIGGFRLDPNSTLGGVIMGLNKLDSTIPFLARGGSSREPAAEGYHRRAVDLGGELLRRDPKRLEYRFLQAHSRRLLAAALYLGGKGQEGFDSLRRAHALLAAITRECPQVDFYAFELAQVHMLAASVGYLRPPFTSGDSLARGVEIFTRLHRRNPGNVLFTASHARGLMRMASHLAAGGDEKGAEEHYRRALEAFDRLLVKVDRLVDYNLLRLRCQKALARILSRQGREKEARELWAQALARAETLALRTEGISAVAKLNFIKEFYLLQAGW